MPRLVLPLRKFVGGAAGGRSSVRPQDKTISWRGRRGPMTEPRLFMRNWH